MPRPIDTSITDANQGSGSGRIASGVSTTATKAALTKLTESAIGICLNRLRACSA
jgi:hypothetical protein